MELFPDVFRISSGYAENEFLLIENRQPIPGDYDELFYEPGGLVIYHIDENSFDTSTFGNFPRGGPFQPDWPENGLHYPVAVVQRDGLYELEQGINIGHADDVYIPGSDALGPGDEGSFPNTDSYAFGNIQGTGLTISNFRVLEGSNPSVMLFDIGGIRQGPTPAPAPGPTESPSLSQSPSERGATFSPSSTPSENPTIEPSVTPSDNPSNGPTSTASENPTNVPSFDPSVMPSDSPSGEPSPSPTDDPTSEPTPAPVLPFQISRPGILRGVAPSIPNRPTLTPVQAPRFEGKGNGKGYGNSSSYKKKASKALAKGKGTGKGKGNSAIEKRTKLAQVSEIEIKLLLGLSDPKMQQ